MNLKTREISNFKVENDVFFCFLVGFPGKERSIMMEYSENFKSSKRNGTLFQWKYTSINEAANQ